MQNEGILVRFIGERRLRLLRAEKTARESQTHPEGRNEQKIFTL